MGIKRLNRSRLFNVEKEGLDVTDTIGISPAMKKALVSATQHREGQNVITDIVLDLGSSAAALYTQSIAVADPIGPTGTDVSYVCRVAQSVFGVVTSVETVCLEAFSDGTMDDVDVIYATGADGYLGSDATGDSDFPSEALADICTPIGLVKVSAFDANELAASSGLYVYLATGLASTKRASATITLTDATVGNLVTGMSAVQVEDADGTAVKFVADSAIAWDAASPAANKFGIGDSAGTGGTMATVGVKGLTYAISHAIHSHSSAGTVFSTDATSRDKTGGGGSDNGATDNATTMTITHAKTGGPKTAENSTTITIVDAYSSLGATKEDFSGGIPNAVTGGKLLIRFNGYMVPDDY